MKVHIAQGRRRAISGIVAALILFVMLFSVGTGYFLWIDTTNGAFSHAQAYRNQAVQQQQLERLVLFPGVCFSGPCVGHLTFATLNAGGSASTIITAYVDYPGAATCTKTIGQFGLTLNPGSTSASTDTGCAYNSGTVTIRVLTARGNLFTAPYPPTQCSGTSAPSISTTLSASSSTAGTPVSDTASFSNGCNPSGNIVFREYSSSACIGSTGYTFTAIVSGNGAYSTGLSSIPTQSVGTYYWQATYSGDLVNSPATSACLTGVATSGTLSTLTDTSQSWVGNQWAGQTIWITSGTDSGTSRLIASNTGNTVTVTPSWASAPDLTSHYTIGEVLSVSKANPLLATSLSATSIPVGQAVSDSATLSSSSGKNAGGTVTYSYYADGTCSGSPMVSPTISNGLIVTVTNGTIPNSASGSFSSIGVYSWEAVYSGDSNNNAATSPCEPLSVTTPTNGETQLPLSVQLSSFKFYYSSGYLVGDATPIQGYYGYVVPGPSQGKNIVFQVRLNNEDPLGRNITLNKQSLIYIQAFNGGSGQCYPYPLYIVGDITDSPPYTGGVTVNPYTSPATIIIGRSVLLNFSSTTAGGTGSQTFGQCASGGQTFTEGGVAPFITGEYSDGTPLSLTLPFTSVFGTSASVTNCTPSLGGNACSALTGNTVTLTFSSGFAVTPSVYAVPSVGGTPEILTCSSGCTSSSFSFVLTPGLGLTEGGYYMLFATDGTNYAYATLHVVKTSSISTTLSQSSIAHGGSVSDSATLSGVTANAGGTVTYEFFTTGTCTGTVTTVSTVTVTNSVVPNSASHTFSGAGAYSWNAVYSGDPNNGGSTSQCEVLTVTTTLTITPATFAHGTGSHALTLTGSSFENSATYSYCLSTSSSTISCVSTSLANPSPGTFTTTGAGAIPPGTICTTTNSITAGTYYMIAYQGNQIIASATLVVT